VPPRSKPLPKKTSTRFAGGYNPELDENPEFKPVMAKFFQLQIGILRWCEKLGYINIISELSKISTHLYLLHETPLKSVFHLFAYLSQHHNTRVVFDPTYPVVVMYAFIKTDWKSMYGDAKEFLPSDTPTLMGMSLTCACLLILIMLVSI
jgi:hypothetical protein